jgi:hypothetical protein
MKRALSGNKKTKVTLSSQLILEKREENSKKKKKRDFNKIYSMMRMMF